MMRFLDGPAAGTVLEVSRAPVLLRVVQNLAGDWDALDALDDRPAEGEKVYVYRREGEAGWVHYDGRDKKGRRFGRTIATAEYRLHASQPDEPTTHDCTAWREWATAEYRKAKANETPHQES